MLTWHFTPCPTTAQVKQAVISVLIIVLSKQVAWSLTQLRPFKGFFGNILMKL